MKKSILTLLIAFTLAALAIVVPVANAGQSQQAIIREKLGEIGAWAVPSPTQSTVSSKPVSGQSQQTIIRGKLGEIGADALDRSRQRRDGNIGESLRTQEIVGVLVADEDLQNRPLGHLGDGGPHLLPIPARRPGLNDDDARLRHDEACVEDIAAVLQSEVLDGALEDIGVGSDQARLQPVARTGGPGWHRPQE